MIAVILSRLESKKAKEILTRFPSDDQKDILYRMATVKDIPPEFLNEVANIIGSKLKYLESDDARTGIDGQNKMAEILKHMGKDKSSALLDAIGAKNPDLADRVSRKVFKFEDIALVEIKGLQHSIAKIETETLALALKGAEDEIKTAVWHALSENRRKMLRDEMKYLGPQKRSAVDQARAELMSVLRGFFDQGILRYEADPSSDEWV